MALWAGVSAAVEMPARFAQAQIVILGEIHDNAAHHAVQADFVAQLRPSALVFEMFGPEAAEAVTGVTPRTPEAVGAALGWDALGWPDFAMYWPIFAAAPEAAIVGAAVPRDQVRQAVQLGAAAVFGAEAARFGLAQDLSEAEQALREALQQEAHCGALPESLLPGMVAAQRLRDAGFARAALAALETYGAPVVVITGTGHARKDWGMPAALARAAPAVPVATLGQVEPGADWASDLFDLVITSPAVARPDPCAGFR